MMVNESTVDRLIRVVVGLGMISLVFIGPQSLWGWIGIVPLLTGVVGFCPAYRIFGIATVPAAKSCDD